MMFHCQTPTNRQGTAQRQLQSELEQLRTLRRTKRIFGGMSRVRLTTSLSLLTSNCTSATSTRSRAAGRIQCTIALLLSTRGLESSLKRTTRSRIWTRSNKLSTTFRTSQELRDRESNGWLG